MRTWPQVLIAFVTASALSAAACGGSSPGAGSLFAANDGGSAPSLGAAQSCADHHQGCACSGAGSMASCGECNDGVTTCVQTAETTQWGPCIGAKSTCGAGGIGASGSGPGNQVGAPGGGIGSGDVPGGGLGTAGGGTSSSGGVGSSGGGGTSSGGLGSSGGGTSSGGVGSSGGGGTSSGGLGSSGGGTADGGTADSGATDGGACTGDCAPGTERWCDEPIYCAWGKQQCTPQGTWGPCTEVAQPPSGCSGPNYDRQCCIDQGQCCEDWNGTDSVGQCGGIACTYNRN